MRKKGGENDLHLLSKCTRLLNNFKIIVLLFFSVKIACKRARHFSFRTGPPKCGHVVSSFLCGETGHSLQAGPSLLSVWMREVALSRERLAWESGQ